MEGLPQLVELRVPYLDPSFEAMVRCQLKFAEEGYEKMSGVQRYVSRFLSLSLFLSASSRSSVCLVERERSSVADLASFVHSVAQILRRDGSRRLCEWTARLAGGDDPAGDEGLEHIQQRRLRRVWVGGGCGFDVTFSLFLSLVPTFYNFNMTSSAYHLVSSKSSINSSKVNWRGSGALLLARARSSSHFLGSASPITPLLNSVRP